MAKVIEQPTLVQAAGELSKTIEEYVDGISFHWLPTFNLASKGGEKWG